MRMRTQILLTLLAIGLSLAACSTRRTEVYPMFAVMRQTAEISVILQWLARGRNSGVCLCRGGGLGGLVDREDLLRYWNT